MVRSSDTAGQESAIAHLRLARSRTAGSVCLPVSGSEKGGRPQFSVIIPTYNYARYIRRAIESVLAQPVGDWELMIVDDGSTDNTREIVSDYGDRLSYVHQPNQGPYAACRTGLLRSRGTYLVFLDADDRLTPDALGVLGAELERDHEVRMVFGRFWSIHPDGRRKLSPATKLGSPDRNFRDFLDGKLRVCTGAAAIHREVFTSLIPYVAPVRTGMDVACLARTLLCFPCRAIDVPLLEVYQHEGRLRDNFQQSCQAGLKLIDVVFDPEMVPPKALRYRRRFVARLERERTRLFYRAGHYPEAVDSYRAAVRAHWRSLLDWRNLRRYVRSLAHREPATSPRMAQPAKKAVTAPGAHWRWGHRRQLQTYPIEFLSRCAREHGDVVRLRLERPTYLLSSPADIRHVLATHRLNYGKTGFQTDFKRFFGKGLLTVEAHEHLAHRRLLQPMFQAKQIDAFSDTIVKAASRLLDQWKDGDVVDMADEMMQLTVVISGKIVFGLDDPSDAQDLYHATRRIHNRLIRRTHSRVRLPEWVPTFRNLRYANQIAAMETFVFEMIRQRRRVGGHSALDGDDDLLAQLLRLIDAAGTKWNDRQLRDHLLTIFLAAYEPTANALTWCWYLLTKNPEAHRRLIAELETVIGPRLPCAEDVGKLPYTRMVIAETLRLYPSTWLLARRATGSDRLPSGVILKAGDEVFISPYVVQRDPRHYDEPERFRPERFEESADHFRAAYQYLPFGAGARVCIGEPLAKLEMALLLATIAPRFRMIRPVDCGIKVESVNLFTIQPKCKVLMRLQRSIA